MKNINSRDVFYAILFLIGIFLYCFLTRYEIVAVSEKHYDYPTKLNFQAYKINKITGQTWFSHFRWWVTFEGTKS